MNVLCLNVKDNRKEEKFEDIKGVIRSCKSKVRRSKEKGGNVLCLKNALIILCKKKKSLKIQRRLSKAINRRTDNTMAKNTNNDQQNTTQKNILSYFCGGIRRTKKKHQASHRQTRSCTPLLWVRVHTTYFNDDM